jgi:hypothetical protein
MPAWRLDAVRRRTLDLLKRAARETLSSSHSRPNNVAWRGARSEYNETVSSRNAVTTSRNGFDLEREGVGH